MERKKVKVYTKLNNLEEIHDFIAIKTDDVIKYIDLDNNIMIVKIKDNIIIRDNQDYTFTMDFSHNKIEIYIKKLKKVLDKEIKTLVMDNKKRSLMIKYLLIDENDINEFYIKY